MLGTLALAPPERGPNKGSLPGTSDGIVVPGWCWSCCCCCWILSLVVGQGPLVSPVGIEGKGWWIVSGDIRPEFGSPCDIGCREAGAAPLKSAAWFSRARFCWMTSCNSALRSVSRSVRDALADLRWVELSEERLPDLLVPRLGKVVGGRWRDERTSCCTAGVNGETCGSSWLSDAKNSLISSGPIQSSSAWVCGGKPSWYHSVQSKRSFCAWASSSPMVLYSSVRPCSASSAWCVISSE